MLELLVHLEGQSALTARYYSDFVALPTMCISQSSCMARDKARWMESTIFIGKQTSRPGAVYQKSPALTGLIREDDVVGGIVVEGSLR